MQEYSVGGTSVMVVSVSTELVALPENMTNAAGL